MAANHSHAGNLRVASPIWFPRNSIGERRTRQEAVTALLRELTGGSVWGRTLVLEVFGDDGPVASYLRSAAEELGLDVLVHAPWERAVFRCGDGTTDVPPATAKERRTKARQWRRMTTDWGDAAVVDRARDPDGSADFLALEASGWKGTAGTALACRAEHAVFYREATSGFAATGRLRLYALQAGGETVAMQTDLCAGGRLFDWKVAYDERFARYGPGTQLQLRVLEVAGQEGVQWIDSCSDSEDPGQLRLSGDRRRIATLVIGARGPLQRSRSALAVFLVKASRRLREWSLGDQRRRLAASSGAWSRVFRR